MNRRHFLQTLGIGLVVVEAGAVQRALAALPKGVFEPTAVDARDSAAHVIARLTFGVTPALYTHVHTIGAQAFIDEQLNFEKIDDTLLDDRLVDYADILAQNGGVLAQQYQKMRQVVTGALVGSWIAHGLYSQRQLHERMVQFFSDHFSIFLGKGPEAFLKIDDDRDAMRLYAMSNFRALLGASAHSPAMLVYLDNAQSQKKGPNENYARELMELHTLGVNGGYSEDDVKQVARALTGWSVSTRKESKDGSIVYRFRPFFHDTSAKQVLGVNLPTGGGEKEGDKVLDILASHPSTAHFISFKLVRRFVADNPPETLVEKCAQTFLQTGGDIRAVLRTIFTADEFWQAPPKFKQPYEYTLSLLRALNYDVLNTTPFLRGIRNPLNAMGQVPFTWPAPNGFPDVAGAWDDNLLARWNIAISAASGKVPGAQAQMNTLTDLLNANNVPSDVESTLMFIGQYLFGRALNPQERDVIFKFVKSAGGNTQQQISSGLALLLASPTFQYK